MIKEKVNKLLNEKFISEVMYPNRLVNVMLIKKVNRKWRVYTKFIDLKKAYLKDSYPLPRID